MPAAIGARERHTQDRIIHLFQHTLGYQYLGNWKDRPDNRPIEETLLTRYLQKQGYTTALISRALHELQTIAGDSTQPLYNVNRAVHGLLRYGVKVNADTGEQTQSVWLIDWKHPENNHFGLAEEVTVKGTHDKRPDLVLYVNGIALGIIELKRSTISITEGIRQHLDNQKVEFIERFFAPLQLLLAGNDTEGVRYGTIGTPEKYYLRWKEPSPIDNLLDRHLTQLCSKARFLELVHDFIVFDARVKKTPRHNQYFGVKASQEHIRRHMGGIVWHTQGSGKSLTMVWLAKWIRENMLDARVLIITDRTELDEQIEKVFLGVDENIYRSKSGADLIEQLNSAENWLICSLIHKFVYRDATDVEGFIAELKKALPADFSPKGNLIVFVDECHRTQSGELNKAMKAILPNAIFIGFTGTPLLKTDKKKSIEVFGDYIHVYKFDEAVKDKVVLDLRYEARDIDQALTSPERIDQWFAAKTRGLTDIALLQLKKKWGTLQKIFSSKSRLEKIVADILMDMSNKPRLMDGRGNAMLVSGSIYQACKFYELFAQTELNGKCAIVTSYKPSTADIKGKETGEGFTERLRQYDIYRKMLSDWFRVPPEEAMGRVEEFELAVKKQFIESPGQMKLLIVVDKLLTGFDAPPATYLYIDKAMRDHGLFQAICRVNRLDGEDKEYGYIIDYKDLFHSLEMAMTDYTQGALDGYDREDVQGLLGDRLSKAREDLEERREAVKALCEPVAPPQGSLEYIHYFCGNSADAEDKEALQAKSPLRMALYKVTSALIRAYTAIANELEEAGYTAEQQNKIKEEVRYFENIRNEVRLSSGDYIDLKVYEPAMRHLIDTYIRAEESRKISEFDDYDLVDLLASRGYQAVKDILPEGLAQQEESMAETIENNIRKLIIDESPVNPKYYEKMSELLETLIRNRREQVLTYQQYLEEITRLAGQVKDPQQGESYPKTLKTGPQRALYDNLDQDEEKAIALDGAIRAVKKDGWRGNKFKEREVKREIKRYVQDPEDVDRIFTLVKEQRGDY